MGIGQRLTDLEQLVQSLASRPQRSPLGPGVMSSNKFKSKWVTANMINVSELDAVSTNTGDLSVTGNLTMTNAGAIRSAADVTYANNTGYYLAVVSEGTPTPTDKAKFRVGTATGAATPQYLAFDGTNIEFRGTMKFGSAGLDKIDSNGLHLEMTDAVAKKIDFTRTDFTPSSEISGFVSTSFSEVKLRSTYTDYGSTSRHSSVNVLGTSSDSSVYIVSQNGTTYYNNLEVLSGTSNTSLTFTTNGTTRLKIEQDGTTSRTTIGTANLKFTNIGGQATAGTINKYMKVEIQDGATTTTYAIPLYNLT